MDYSKNIMHSIEYIDNHLLDDLNAEKIANNEGYSVFHFCRLFKKYQGISIMQYVRDKRLEQANYEIINGKSEIGDIAYKYGFETTSGFSRAYQKKYGIRPKKGS